MGILSSFFGKDCRDLSDRYAALADDAAKRARASSTDPETAAKEVAKKCGLHNKPREFTAYKDVAAYLIGTYEPEVAYFVAVEINEQYAQSLGYIPIGQIVLAVEHLDKFKKGFIVKTEELEKNPSLAIGINKSPERTKRAVAFLTYALLNFPNIGTARKAFTVYRVPEMRENVLRKLRALDQDVANYIAG